MSELLNSFFSLNDFLTMSILLVASVFAGNCLQPVPKFLSKLFDSSVVLKYVTLFVGAVTTSLPLDDRKLIVCMLAPIAVLIAFDVMRYFDETKTLKLETVKEPVTDVASIPMKIKKNSRGRKMYK